MDDEMNQEGTNLQHQYSHSSINIKAESECLSSANANVQEQDEVKTKMDKSSSTCLEMTEMPPISQEYIVKEIVEKQPGNCVLESNSDFEDEPEYHLPEMPSSSTAIFEDKRSKIENYDELKLFISPRPDRCQVLRYFARAAKFKIRRVEREFQITDSDEFTLFDAYIDVDCAGRIWTIESYGKVVIFMREYTTTSARIQVCIRDWNGEFLGEFSPGDPFYIYATGKSVLAKFGSSATYSGNNEETNFDQGALLPKRSASWICVQEENQRHIVRLDDYQLIHYNKDVSFKLKLLCLASIVRLVGQAELASTANCVGIVKSVLNCCAGI